MVAFCLIVLRPLAAQPDDYAGDYATILPFVSQTGTVSSDTIVPKPDGSPRFVETSKGKVYVQPDDMPYFGECESRDGTLRQACSDANFVKYVQEHIQYPQEAVDAGTQGTILAQFIVNDDGKVANAAILHDIGDGCGEAALQLLRNMPRWAAGRVGGKAVNVQLDLPINFQLPANMMGNYKMTWGSLRGATAATREEILLNMDEPILVRDQFGNEVSPIDLLFSYTRRKKVFAEKSNGELNKRMRHIVEKKMRNKGELLLRVAIQVGGELMSIEKKIAILKK